jgi:hypothetical protein
VSPFVEADAAARIVPFVAEGDALRGADARSVTDAVEARLATVRASRAGVGVELTGGHAIAAAAERMLRRDLWMSGALSTLLGELAFAVTFRRFRALAAVMPPLAPGTLWTAATAAGFPAGLSTFAVVYANPRAGDEAELETVVRSAAPAAVVTGYASGCSRSRRRGWRSRCAGSACRSTPTTRSCCRRSSG